MCRGEAGSLGVTSDNGIALKCLHQYVSWGGVSAIGIFQEGAGLGDKVAGRRLPHGAFVKE